MRAGYKGLGDCPCGGTIHPEIDRDGYTVERCAWCGTSARVVRRHASPADAETTRKKKWHGRVARKRYPTLSMPQL